MGAAPTGKETYEWRRTQAVLRAEALEIDPAAEGKRVAYVRILRDDVFVDGELFPTWLNVFHARTRARIVRRELLLREGDRYENQRAEESMRILRGMGIFALVRIVAVRTHDSESVGILVHTRDLWSLRLESSFNISTQINALNFGLVERNLGGIGHRAAVRFSLRPDTFSASESYGTRRTLGREFALSEQVGVIFSRASSRPEGGFSSVVVGRPFYNLAQRRAYSITGRYESKIVRRLVNGNTQPWIPEGHDSAAGLRIWDQRKISAQASFASRTGHKRRHTFRVFTFFEDRRFAPNAESDVPLSLIPAFAQQVTPRARREVGPGVSYDLFVPRYRIYTHLDTYGQSENVRLGPQASFSVSAPLTILGSSAEARLLRASAGWSWDPGGGLLRVSGGPRARWEDGEWVDLRLLALVRAATRMLGPVRIVARVHVSLRWKDTNNSFVSLGSDNGLRGFPSQHLRAFGANSLLANLELRTRPIDWRGVQLGGVLFYDFGSVFEWSETVELAHGVGVGLRLLLPQFNRVPWTGDAGFVPQPLRVVPSIRSSQVTQVN
ncbi:MAG: BamA/TamA family outer membrane protein [Nannocystaceae bacterium]